MYKINKNNNKMTDKKTNIEVQEFDIDNIPSYLKNCSLIFNDCYNDILNKLFETEKEDTIYNKLIEVHATHISYILNEVFNKDLSRSQFVSFVSDFCDGIRMTSLSIFDSNEKS